jgi:UDP-glucose 4-epimerase
MRSVLITGAAGFVGGHLCRAFAEAGFTVTGLDRVSTGNSFTRACARFRMTDLLSDEDDSADPFPTVIHLAGLLPGKVGRREIFAVNVGGTSAVLHRYVSADTHLVLVSTGLVYGDQPAPFREAMPGRPRDAYAESKLAAEEVARAGCAVRGAKLTIARPSVLYGPGAPDSMLLVSMMAALRRGERFPMTPGEQQRDFLHVDDLASAIVEIARRQAAGVFNLAAGESHQVREVAAMAAEITGRGDLLALGQLSYRPGEVFDYRLDAQAAQAALDWRPRVLLREGLTRLWKETP